MYAVIIAPRSIFVLICSFLSFCINFLYSNVMSSILAGRSLGDSDIAVLMFFLRGGFL